MPEEYAGKIRTQKDADELIKEQHARHVKGSFQWLDQKTADAYRKKSKDAKKEGQTCNTKETLKKELQEIYGLNEIEAVNLLAGYHISDYVNKYERIRTMTPLHLKKNETET